jgi:hypothetical protein
MDTTWSIMRDYVTAYCVVISRNIAIPISFAFGLVEDYGLDHNFWMVFSERFGVDLTKFALESD